MGVCKWCDVEYAGGRPADFGSDPKCAFSEGTFSSDNWNCAGMMQLRTDAEEVEVWSEDEHCAVLPFDGRFIVVSYYKHRGRTDGAWIVESAETRLLTAGDVEDYLAWKQRPDAR